MLCTLMTTRYWIINDDKKSTQNVYFICNIKIANRSINLVTKQLSIKNLVNQNTKQKLEIKTFLNILFFKGFKIFWLVNQ